MSLKTDTYFAAIHCNFHLDLKLDYTITRSFQEDLLSEYETQHNLYEIERTYRLQPLVLALFQVP